MISGPPGTALNITSDATTQHTMAVAAKVGCEDSSDLDSKILECLRDVTMHDLLHAAMGYSIEKHPPAGAFTFIPSLDDYLIPDRPFNLMEAGDFVKGKQTWPIITKSRADFLRRSFGLWIVSR